MRIPTFKIQNLWRVLVIWLALATTAFAQDADLEFLTVERPPFAFEQDGLATGFSIELMREIAASLDREVNFTFVEEFPDMLAGVAAGEADGAVANISITSEREADLDFSRPIFGSGLKVLVSGSSSRISQAFQPRKLAK